MIKDFVNILMSASKEASDAILRIYQSNFEVEIKSDNSPVTEADKLSSKIIVRHLETTKIPVISEEEDKLEYEKRKNLPYIWLVDPIDGTKEFVKKTGQFCISIALIQNGKPVLGFIADPLNQIAIYGGKGIGAFKTPYSADSLFDKKWEIKQLESATKKVILHSNGGFSGSVVKFVRKLEEKFGNLEVVKKGSALKFFDLVEGNADFYVRLAPTMEWDISAGQAIYEAVGGEVIHFETRKPLTYNKPQLKNPYFIAKRKHLKI
ncbi:MAG: 3'(2'),5'-bisphosphate nucleotidase CysQ [Crocinitomicaceae bacterium]